MAMAGSNNGSLERDDRQPAFILFGMFVSYFVEPWPCPRESDAGHPVIRLSFRHAAWRRLLNRAQHTTYSTGNRIRDPARGYADLFDVF